MERLVLTLVRAGVSSHKPPRSGGRIQLINYEGSMMLRCNSLLAIVVLCAGAHQTTAAEPSAWTITVAPYTGAVRTISISAPGTSSPILLDQNASVGLSADVTDRGNSKDLPLVRPDSVGSLVHASPQIQK